MCEELIEIYRTYILNKIRILKHSLDLHVKNSIILGNPVGIEQNRNF